MTRKTRKTRAQLSHDTAWTPAIAAGAALAALHVYAHGIIGALFSASQVAAVLVMAVTFGLFRKKHRQGVGIWLGRFVGYGLLGLVYQTLIGGLGSVAAYVPFYYIDALPSRGIGVYLTLEAAGLVAILLPALVAFLSRPKARRDGRRGVASMVG